MKQLLFNFLILSWFSLGIMAADGSDSLAVIQSWTLTDNFTRSVPHDVDTSLPNFQHYHQGYAISTSNTTLANLGSPIMSNYFVLRNEDDMAFFLKPYLAYFQTAENTQYYNTRKPFSRMYYTYGPGISNKEQSFEALHTQNINSKLNFVLRYHNISSRGQYPNLHVKKNVYRVASSYSGNRYIMHGAFNFNRYNAGESGGLKAPERFELSYDNVLPIDLVSRISSNNDRTSRATKTIRYYDVMVSQRLKLFTLETEQDTSASKKGGVVAEPVLTHVFKMDRASMFYQDLTGSRSGVYDTYYFNTDKTVDTVVNYRVQNTLQLEFKTTFRKKYQVGLYGMAGHRFEKVHYKSEWDSTWVATDTTLTLFIRPNGDTLKGIDQRDHFSTVFLSGGVYGNIRNKVKLDFAGTAYLAGYKAGQTELKGGLNTQFNLLEHDLLLDLNGQLTNKKPNYLLENFYSNNFIYTGSLLPENEVRLSGIIGHPSKNFDIRGNYYLLRNLIYFNEQAKPENYEQLMNYFSVEVTKTFYVWKLSSTNKLIYQVSENQNVLPLPSIIAYNSTFIDHTFRFKKTGGELEAILGVDIYYNTQFYGYEYAPALSQFYVQNSKKIGNRPMADAYLNLKLKQVRFFFKTEHFNSYITYPYSYFSAIRYPYNSLTYRFGVSWVFYD